MKIAIVTREIEGLDRNGGIGTANRRLAEHLAGNHEILLCHTGNPGGVEEKIFSNEMKKIGIPVEYIHSDADLFHANERRPHAVYRFLRGTDCDVYLFHEYLADGFFCFLAKRTGVAFRRARLGVVAHSSSQWCDEANRRFPDSAERLSLYDMERACCELADFVVSPSHYLLDWMRGSGWTLPAESVCIPNLVSPPGASVPRERASRLTAEEVREIVFFGRLEERKGALTFADALNLLPEGILTNRTVTFLGSACGYSIEDMRRRLEPALTRDGFELKFIDNFDSRRARDYLKQPGRIAVMPSHCENSPCAISECLEDGIPFLASSVGGGKELIHPEERESAIFQPDKRTLANLLVRVLRMDGIAVPRPFHTQEKIVESWETLLSRIVTKEIPEPPVHDEKPLVSLVLVHHDRPELLKHSLQSCADQDYPNLEIILVDDGSSDPAALAYLHELETSPPHPGFRLLRRENKYLGAARNAGMREARGEFVVFLDDDNVALPDMVSRFVEAILFSGADVVSGAMRFFHNQLGAPGGRTAMKNQLCAFWGGFMHYSAALVNHFGDATAIYKRSVLLQTGGFHETPGVTHEDWKMFVDIENLGGKIIAIPDMMFWYRVTDGSMIRSTSAYLNAQKHLAPYAARLPENSAHFPFVAYALEEARRNRAHAFENAVSPRNDLRISFIRDLYDATPAEVCHPTYLRLACYATLIGGKFPLLNRAAVGAIHLGMRIRRTFIQKFRP